jgi:serine/threonine protein kinase
MSRKTFKLGKRFLGYQILHLIGQGALCDIYYVHEHDSSRFCALKVEKRDHTRITLDSEQDILQRINGTVLFPEFIAEGTTENYRYLGLEALGPSLSAVQKVLPDRKFSISTSLHIGTSMLRCVQAFHSAGYVHRDIKPGNFLIRGSRANPVALIDFGLARKHLQPATGTPFVSRSHCGFVGTNKYASPSVYTGKDVGRRDDLMSWWYSVVEMANGELPWGEERDKTKTFTEKSASDCGIRLTTALPSELLTIHQTISALRYEDQPDYDAIMQLMVRAMKASKCNWRGKFDWEERIDLATRNKLSYVNFEIPDGEEPTIPTFKGEGCCSCCSVY